MLRFVNGEKFPLKLIVFNICMSSRIICLIPITGRYQHILLQAISCCFLNVLSWTVSVDSVVDLFQRPGLLNSHSTVVWQFRART